jgi:aspartate/tyrosine/aromatic aminotransferase
MLLTLSNTFLRVLTTVLYETADNARCGALHVVTRNKEAAGTVKSALKGIIRPMYSNPPNEGAAVAVLLLQDPASGTLQ